jgi:hypothetical protein
MKQLIKQILKEESLKQDLKQSVKDYGWESTANLIGGSKNLVKIAFNNDPMEFLNIYNDLNAVKSEEDPNYILFRYKKGNNIMVYNRKNEDVFINYNEIWPVLRMEFGLEWNAIKPLIEKWLSKVYDMRGVTIYLPDSLPYTN